MKCMWEDVLDVILSLVKTAVNTGSSPDERVGALLVGRELNSQEDVSKLRTENDRDLMLIFSLTSQNIEPPRALSLTYFGACW